MARQSSMMRKLMVMMMAFAVMFAYAVVPMNQAFAASAKKPAKVKIAKAVAVSESAVKVTWKKAKNAKKYQVYASTQKKKGFKKVATVKASKKAYTVKKLNKKALKPDTKYFFKVRALNGKKKGKFSAVKAARTKKAEEPAPAKLDYVKMNAEDWAKLGTNEIKDGDYIIDVRTAANFKYGWLDGSVNVPVSNPYKAEEANAIKAEFDKANGRRIVIICNSGNMLAKNAMAALQEKGADMSNVTYLIGGAKKAKTMDKWVRYFVSLDKNSDEWKSYGIEYSALSYSDDYVLDVRPEAAYKQGHIVGSTSFPVPGEYKDVDTAGLKAAYDNAAGKRVVIVCVKGKTLAGNAMQALQEEGADMSKVTYLIGGADGVASGDFVNNLGVKEDGLNFDDTEVFLDVRKDGKSGENFYLAGHFKGSKRANIQENGLSDQVKGDLDAAYSEANGKKIVIVCVSGHGLAKQAMGYYQSSGKDLKNITYLIGGANGVSESIKSDPGKWESGLWQ